MSLLLYPNVQRRSVQDTPKGLRTHQYTQQMTHVGCITKTIKQTIKKKGRQNAICHQQRVGVRTGTMQRRRHPSHRRRITATVIRLSKKTTLWLPLEGSFLLRFALEGQGVCGILAVSNVRKV